MDTTVVLLTPVVFATAARLDVRARPHVYACTHLANSAPLLLPGSNLTNLLAFAASGLAFGRFAALMALPWLVVIGVEYAVFGRFFASDLSPAPQARPDAGAGDASIPVFGGPTHPTRHTRSPRTMAAHREEPLGCRTYLVGQTAVGVTRRTGGAAVHGVLIVRSVPPTPTLLSLPKAGISLT